MEGKGKVWVTDRTAEIPIQVGDSGIAAAEPETVMTVFARNVEKFANEPALMVKREGAWRTWTWKEYSEDVHRAARAMIHLGLGERDCINVIGFNSPEWHIADVASIAAGGIAAGIYTTNGPDSCLYITEHSGAKIVFVENDQQMEKFLEIEDRLPNVVAYVQWIGTPPKGDKYLSWEDFMRLGDKVDQSAVDERIANTRPGHCCSLIYTSGTTGPPKAVMISHDNVTWTTKSLISSIDLEPGQIVVGYLPLSHIAAQIVDIHAPMALGGQVWFAQPDALRGSLGATLKEVRPTMFLGVPRVWEKIYEKMMEIGKETQGLKKTIATWAKGVGLAGSYAEQRGEGKPWGWTVANALVFGNVRTALGLDRCTFCATAAAPIAKEVLDYFNSLYIPIYEVYGMSECTGPQTTNHPGEWKTATVGVNIPGSELKLADETDEIWYRGRHIFMGYMNNDEATAETVDEDGWLHSGDVGKLDEDGFLSITGRIKELIITAGGENIAPVLIEDEIKKEIGDIVSNVQVIGDKRKYLTCLITLRVQPNPNAADGEYPFTEELIPDVAEKTGSSAKTVGEAQNDAKINEYIKKGIEAANARATSNAQRVQKHAILERDFSIDGGELTPTLKLKRRITVQKYEDVIEGMYA